VFDRADIVRDVKQQRNKFQVCVSKLRLRPRWMRT
jgi:hypothetical protein